MTKTRPAGSGGAGSARAAARRSSVRWRSERPPIVLLGEMRHCCRILLAFTRPYFGTASSMSKTFAVSTYSGGSSSSVWIDTRPALRSRLSWARRVRICVRALERVHALDAGSARGPPCASAAESVAGGIGRRVYIIAPAQQGSRSRIRLHLDLRSRLFSVVDGCMADLQGFSSASADARRSAGRCPALCGNARARPRSALPASGSRKLSVPTATSVAPASSRSRHARPVWTPPMPTIGIATRARDRADLRQRDGAHRRARQSARPAAEPRRAGAAAGAARSRAAC